MNGSGRQRKVGLPGSNSFAPSIGFRSMTCHLLLLLGHNWKYRHHACRRALHQPLPNLGTIAAFAVIYHSGASGFSARVTFICLLYLLCNCTFTLLREFYKEQLIYVPGYHFAAGITRRTAIFYISPLEVVYKTVLQISLSFAKVFRVI